MTSPSSNLKSEWRKCVSENIRSLSTRFKDVNSDKGRLELAGSILKQDPWFSDIIEKLKSDIKAKSELKCEHVNEFDPFENRSLREDGIGLPTLAKDKHPKISNGSVLIEMGCTKSQGRYLKAKEQIKAGDVLILEKPYTAVLVPENKNTHCSHCFELLEEDVMSCTVCKKVKYCSVSCKLDAWKCYHKHECSLEPLLEMLELSSHLALRLLLVSGLKTLRDFVHSRGGCADLLCSDEIPGCTTDGLYSGDYSCVHNLVTNTDLQPTAALVSFALDAACITEIAFGHVYGDHSSQSESRNGTNDSSNFALTKENLGCLLLHHMQQMPCNIHAVTAIVSVNEQAGVWSKEQRRIAAGIYPTASLMNHACDPDVIVSFIGRTLVVRATHNIQPGEEIAHCYGPSASRMSREVRQSLLQKQYFFICNCSACKSDKDLEEQYIFDASYICPKCSSVVKVSRENDKNMGKCQNAKCGYVNDFSFEVDVVKNAQKLFGLAVASLEQGQGVKCLETLKECLKKRQNVLQRYDKDVAETHDALARCNTSLGDFRQAAFHCEQSTESVRRRFGSESVEYAHELHKLAQLLFNGKLTNKALTVIESGIRLLTIHYGAKYADVEELQNMRKTLRNFMKGKT